VNTEKTVTKDTKGWLFYDADCALCVRSAIRAERLLGYHGFYLLPLQTPGTPERLGVTPEALSARMHLLTREGRRFAGADAFVEVGWHVRWARPFAAATRLPGVMPLLRRIYDWIAAHRYCIGRTCRVPNRRSILDWLPLMLLPIAVFAVRGLMPDWVFMWALAFALFTGCKWLTYREAVANSVKFGAIRTLGYLFGWVGMDPAAFASKPPPTTPATTEWLAAFGRVALGVTLVWGAVRFVNPSLPLVAGWLGMFGIILLLHFGCFELFALAWRRAGVPVKPLMRAPLLATSLGDFWSARWNTGFHALAHKFLFRPLARIFGKIPAVLGVFLVSGLVHDLVITLPARGGYGLPTAYFLLQGFGLVFERSAFGRGLGLGAGIRGRIFALAVTAGPAFWLFPPVFIHHVILPMLHAIGAN